uniref:Translationally-controlled tumor protein n=1 Tax=Sus scrofa TaxID=9823 RepID=A0A8D1CEE6_PIG
MIIYRDLISHDEMFSDIYKIREIADGLCLEVEGKMVSRTEGNIDDSLIGGNASAEGPEGEGTESTVITGVDIVMNHHLQETSFTKEAYKKYIKDYMKSIKGKLEEQRPERVKPFMTGAAEQIKHILANFKNYQFFIGENMNPDGMVALLDYREDGVTPYMIFFKDGLEMEKCVSTKKWVEISNVKMESVGIIPRFMPLGQLEWVLQQSFENEGAGLFSWGSKECCDSHVKDFYGIEKLRMDLQET